GGNTQLTGLSANAVRQQWGGVGAGNGSDSKRGSGGPKNGGIEAQHDKYAKNKSLPLPLPPPRTTTYFSAGSLPERKMDAGVSATSSIGSSGASGSAWIPVVMTPKKVEPGGTPLLNAPGPEVVYLSPLRIQTGVGDSCVGGVGSGSGDDGKGSARGRPRFFAFEVQQSRSKSRSESLAKGSPGTPATGEAGVPRSRPRDAELFRGANTLTHARPAVPIGGGLHGFSHCSSSGSTSRVFDARQQSTFSGDQDHQNRERRWEHGGDLRGSEKARVRDRGRDQGSIPTHKNGRRSSCSSPTRPEERQRGGARMMEGGGGGGNSRGDRGSIHASGSADLQVPQRRKPVDDRDRRRSRSPSGRRDSLRTSRRDRSRERQRVGIGNVRDSSGQRGSRRRPETTALSSYGPSASDRSAPRQQWQLDSLGGGSSSGRRDRSDLDGRERRRDG
ncbi:unnamed protein product, partial [Pylaiella littoralis]